MNFENRLNKIEENLFSDKDIDDICGARYVYRQLLESGHPADDVAEVLKNECENVPVYLLTVKLSGRLASAEKAYIERMAKPLTPAESKQIYERLKEKGFSAEDICEYFESKNIEVSWLKD